MTLLFLDLELISYRYLSCSCSCWGDRLQKAEGSVVSNRIEMKFGKIVLQVMHRLTKSDFDLMSYIEDGDRDVILRRKVLPPGE